MAHQPWPSGDTSRSGHVRRQEGRPVHHDPVGRHGNRSRRRRRRHLPVTGQRAGQGGILDSASGRDADSVWRGRRPPAIGRWCSSHKPAPEALYRRDPWSLQTSFYPRGLAAQGAERLFEPADILEGTVRYLGETLGLKQVGYRDWISVRTPNEAEAEFFKLPQDGRVGVFEVFRTAFDQTGTPMRLTITIFPTDRNQFIVNDGQVPPLQPHRGASTKKSLANPLQAGQATFASLVSVVTARHRKDHTLEPTKSSALCSRITGRVSRFLPWSSSVATAEEGARWTPFAARRGQSFPRPFPLSPSPGSPHDVPQPYLDAWQTADETVTAPMLIAKATVADLPVVLSLVNEASEWLRAKETDQWATPWPSEEGRNNRILMGLRNEKTWIVWDGDIAAATVTIATRANTKSGRIRLASAICPKRPSMPIG